MTLTTRLEYLRLEQEEMLRLVSRLEEALGQAVNQEFETRRKALIGLHALDRGLLGVGEHCHSEDRIVESTLRRYSNKTEYARLNAEHADMLRLLSDFREGMEFATADSIADVIPAGKELIQKIREHIAYERTFLDRIDTSESVPEEVLIRYTESPE
jgi:hemerythrin-like domain-containing protein